MADRGEFASYVVARWHAVVRTLVLLGHEPAEADAIAVEGLSRCVRDFDRERRETDVEVFVHRTVLAVRRHRGVASTDAEVVPPTSLPDLEDRLARLADLLALLDTLPPEERAVEALRLGAELSDVQIEEVLDERPMSWRAAAFDHGVTEAIAVRPAPVDEVLARHRARRRRRTRWTAGVTAALVAVVGAATWLGTRPVPDDTPDGRVEKAANPAAVAWYADRTLHLRDVTVEVAGLVSMVEVPDGVVYSDKEGRVVFADQLGRLFVLGHTDPELPVVGNGERGSVAWLETRRAGPALVAWDTIAGREFARRSEGADTRVVSFDQATLYFERGDVPYAWDLSSGVDPTPEPGGTLLDVASLVKVTAFSSTSIRVEQPLFDVVLTMPGTDAELSPEGDLVLTHVDFDLPDEVRIYEAGSGNLVPTGLRPHEVALAATLGPRGTVTYVVGHREQAPDSGEFVRLSESGSLLLRTCDLRMNACRTLAQIPNDAGPVLPG